LIEKSLPYSFFLISRTILISLDNLKQNRNERIKTIYISRAGHCINGDIRVISPKGTSRGQTTTPQELREKHEIEQLDAIYFI